jgi:hypothetical protein
MKTVATLALVYFLFHAGISKAEDIDIFRASVKNNAMMVFDTSGSMSMPVYDPVIDYASFMKMMIDDNIAVDENDCRSGSTWWDSDGSGNEYNRLSPDHIYLVSTWSDISNVSYMDSTGLTQHVLAINDILKNTGSETDPLVNKRYPLLTSAIIPVKNNTGNAWNVNHSDSINSDSDGHVLFPDDNLTDVEGHDVIVSLNLRQSRLPECRDMPVTKIEQDPVTGEYVQAGFSGILQSSGFYFSGLYEKEGASLEITDNVIIRKPILEKKRYIFLQQAIG